MEMAEIPTTPPPLQGPSSKEKKYDRQLRLWAAAGQEALENAHVLLLNSGCGVVGVEILKNLILPGVGRFTIYDPKTVTEEDLGVNFFLDEDSLGQSRAERTCALLQELNPDVRVDFKSESINELVSEPANLDPYTLILVTSPVERRRGTEPLAFDKVLEYAQLHDVPMIYVLSIGFYSSFSLFLPAIFPIVETHPDPTSTTDLRLLNPWPELLDFVKEKTEHLDQLDDHDHGHVPYLLLLLHYLDEWKAAHGGRPPENYKEKTEFREWVRKGARTNNSEGAEENFDEAVAAVLKNLNPPSLSSSVREVVESDECRNLQKGSANFWFITSAIKTFYTNHSVLPLPGSLPDMKAQSADYIRLQNIYKAKARKDVAEVLATVRELEGSLSHDVPIDEKEVEAFCKGAAFIKVIQGRKTLQSKHYDMPEWGDRAKSFFTALQDPTSLAPLYIALYTYDSHRQLDKPPPSPPPTKTTDDIASIKNATCSQAHAIIESLWADNGHDLNAELANANATDDDDDVRALKTRVEQYVAEIVRAGEGELHNVAALTGGMVAQEAIKVMTRQYVPVDNVCVFDGVTSRVGVFKR
ncbi:MAG: hypothetical protein M1833_005657 [Piccolia ochrophora]|nr:MAG: hypothetical protein M1833_005657 [Piccolia ochrophora]